MHTFVSNEENFLCISLNLQDVTLAMFTSSPLVVLLEGVLKICSKFTGEQPCQSAISIKLQIEITLRDGCLL